MTRNYDRTKKLLTLSECTASDVVRLQKEYPTKRIVVDSQFGYYIVKIWL